MNKPRFFALLPVFLFFAGAPGYGRDKAPKQEYYAIKVYQLKTSDQEAVVSAWLQKAYLPALHRLGIRPVGVFLPVGNDTAAIRRIYVLIPFHTLEQFVNLPLQLEKDRQFLEDGKGYLDANYKEPPYARIESILLQAFPGMPTLQTSTTLKDSARAERIYELRSYEGPTERYFANKVQMFNQGGEIGLFQRLGFNAVFYASVLSGVHMPNLMYMTSFANMASRDEHWKAFGADPVWKQLSTSPEYQNNVSHIDIVFLHQAAFSDL
ncbi:MAG: NIPSNAP family protein [Bacteroidota bacterium]|nr:NIPSNAP family protein [Bacteroidota bacterium]MDP4218255.1 NIPSNAP family protein [Bacteroidota bacterium]MDP4245790.1 NIPSNAP family protein [Bacteroidota bacterium]MDP4253538.1 NIPSNAP family protein [Bacteroidota bacterium]MDP4257064.1 NIPSNAP family protein [Bacteroidota bacterium]